MTAKLIGERAYDYYRKHPAAASILLANGDAVDAGTAIDIDSNIGHLEYEGVRHLVSSMGGQRQTFSTEVLALAGYDDVTPPTFDGTYASTADNQKILWGPNTCYRFGPFDIIADRIVQGTDPGAGRYVLRPVSYSIDLWSDTTNFTSTTGIFALTQSGSRQALFDGDYLALDTIGFLSGRRTGTGTLTCDTPITPANERPWPCRDTSDRGATEVLTVPVWVWFGHLFLNTANLPAYINSMSAWEVRDGTE